MAEGSSRRAFLQRTVCLGAAFSVGHLLAAAPNQKAGAKLQSPTGIPVEPGDWPWWRGPGLNNVSTERNPLIQWGPQKNVAWKIALSGRGHASPAIVGKKIFIATADEQTEVLQMLCFNREDGTKLWKTDIHKGGFLKKHDKNSHASATPACDGALVFFPALFEGALWVTALDLTGKIKWQTKVSAFVPSNGYGSSPVLYKENVIVSSDNTGEPCLMSLNRKSGEVTWRAERPKSDNFSSPIIGRLSGRDQLLLCGARMIASYDPADGKQIWFAESPTEVTATTMAFDSNWVVGGGNVPVREFMCVRADGRGNVTNSHLLWRSKKNVTYVPAPLIHDGLLYIINDSGIVACLEPGTEKEIYKERLANGPLTITSSPIWVDEKIFVTSESGKTFVLQAGREFKILATNDLAEETLATPVFSHGQWFIRTSKHLYCIGAKSS